MSVRLAEVFTPTALQLALQWNTFIRGPFAFSAKQQEIIRPDDYAL